MNKRSIAIAVTAALLLAAVLCTAGCVDAPSDPVVGTYVTETDSAVTYAFFEEGGAGCFAGDAENTVFTWTAGDPKKTYTLTFADKATETAVLNAARGVLNVDGVLYQKTVSPLSGTSVTIMTEQGVIVVDPKEYGTVGVPIEVENNTKAERGNPTIGEVEDEKYPSGLSGQVPPKPMPTESEPKPNPVPPTPKPYNYQS